MFGFLVILFIVVPIAEIYLLSVASDGLGWSNVILLIIGTGVLGASLTRIQGLKVLAQFQSQLQSGRVPHNEIVDGFLILFAGAVLLTPGFITDAVGFLLLVPLVRRGVRYWLGRWAKSRIDVRTFGAGGHQVEGQPPSSRPDRPESISDAPVTDVDFEVHDRE